jgi:hypothetical protein
MSTCPANPTPDPLPRKPAVPFDAEKIPASLKAERRWVCWNYAIREGKPTKAPINARTGRKAASTRPSTLSTFDEAVSSFRTHGYAGVGYVLGDGWAGVDVDGCIDPKAAIAPAAQEIISALSTYSEVSPSGQGVKMIMLGTKPAKVRCKAKNVPGCKAVEVYGHDRFFTMTGRQLEGTPSTVEPRQEALDALRAKLFPPKQKAPPPPAADGNGSTTGFPGSDDQLIEKARKAKNGDKFSRLWAGEISQYQDDDSAADQALCNILAFWCGNDPVRIDRLFRRSGLYREKWERENYRDPTIAKAIESCPDPYTGHRRKPQANAGDVPAGRPEVILDTEEHRAIDEVAAALAADPDLYQRGRMLTRVIREAGGVRDGVKRPKGSVTIVPVAAATLRERISKYAQLLRIDDEGELVPAHPTGWLVGGVEARGWWPSLRRLTGVSDVPVLRPDGTVWQSEGYDRETGVLYLPTCEFPAVPDHPTRDDAWAAIEQLTEVVYDFRFVSDAHRAAWISSLLTPLARPAYHGPTPLFMVDANIRGAGKGLLTHAVGTIILGRPMPVSAYTQDDDEMRKRITAIAIAGDQLILLDNLDGKFGNPALDAALTGTQWNDRLLGRNAMVSLPLSTVWFATGNNVMVAADTIRRLVHIRLEVMDENPEDRSGFRHPDLLRWVGSERPRLVVAGLTVLAAYCRAGCPAQNLKPMGSFEGWSDLVRSALVWAGQADPCASRKELAETADTTKESLGQLLAALEEYAGVDAGFIVADMLRALYPGHGTPPSDAASGAMRAALEGLVNAAPGKTPTTKQVGTKFRHVRKRVIDDLYLDHNPAEKQAGGAVWKLLSTRELPI